MDATGVVPAMNAAATAVLHLGAGAATLTRGRTVHTLPFGTRTIAALFHTEPPAGHEIERAIDEIEDALMRVAAPLHGPGALAIDAGEWLAWSGGTALPLSAVEDRFQRLASAALGRPGALRGWPADTGSAAVLVIVREVMHHLRFEAAAPLAAAST
jgi:hypothetical protein